MTTTRIPKPRRRVSAANLRRTLYWLSQDWIHLNTTLPVPSSPGGRSSNVRAYGHPAEWASDQCARISDLFWSWHDLVAELRDETPPAAVVVDRRRVRREQDVIVAAWKYLEPRIDDLVAAGHDVPFDELPVPWYRKWDWDIDDEAFDEVFDLHRHIRNRTGQSHAKVILPMPCPNLDCGMLALVRAQGMAQDFVICGACGYTVPDRHYRFLVDVLLDTLADAA